MTHRQMAAVRVDAFHVDVVGTFEQGGHDREWLPTAARYVPLSNAVPPFDVANELLPGVPSSQLTSTSAQFELQANEADGNSFW